MEQHENKISLIVLDAAITVHREIGGAGLLEAIYEEALVCELELRGLQVQRQVQVPIFYKGKQITHPMRLDILINDKVIVECKAIEKLNPLFKSQLLTYLRFSGKKLGLLVNFGAPLIKDGFYRVVNGL